MNNAVSVTIELPPAKAEQLLESAVTHERALTFLYRKLGSPISEVRRVDPIEMRTTRAGRRLVIGLDRDRGEFRAFRAERINNVVIHAADE